MEKPARTDRYGDPLPAGALARLGTRRLCQSGVVGLAFSPDAKVVAAVDRDGALCLWEVRTGKQVRRLQAPPFQGYSPAWRPLAFSPDGTLLALACEDQRVRLWDVGTGKELHRLPSAAFAETLAFSPDGRCLACGGGDPFTCTTPSRARSLAS